MQDLVVAVGTGITAAVGLLMLVLGIMKYLLNALLEPMRKDIIHLQGEVRGICPLTTLEDKTALAIRTHQDECTQRLLRVINEISDKYVDQLRTAVAEHERRLHHD